MHTNTFREYRKKPRASPRVHLLYIIEYIWKKCRIALTAINIDKNTLYYTLTSSVDGLNAKQYLLDWLFFFNIYATEVVAEFVLFSS